MLCVNMVADVWSLPQLQMATFVLAQRTTLGPSAKTPKIHARRVHARTMGSARHNLVVLTRVHVLVGGMVLTAP